MINFLENIDGRNRLRVKVISSPKKRVSVLIKHTNHYGLAKVFKALVRRMAGLCIETAFFLPKNWRDHFKTLAKQRSENNRPVIFYRQLSALKRLCIISQIVFDDIDCNRKLGNLFVGQYEQLWSKYVGHCTSYAHLLAHHTYDNSYDLGKLSAENIEILNKKQRSIIENMTLKGRKVPFQLMKIANIYDSFQLPEINLR